MSKLPAFAANGMTPVKKPHVSFCLIASPLIALLLLGTGAQVSRAATVLTTMGVTAANNNGTIYQHGSEVIASTGGVAGTVSFNGTTVYYNLEDQDDNAGLGGLLGPEAGGQQYDAEFLGVSIVNGVLSIGILTGQRWDNSEPNFSPGDIHITTSTGDFWVEVGGSAHVGNVPGDIGLGDVGSTYKIIQDTGHTDTLANGGVTATLHAGDVVSQLPGNAILTPGFSSNMPAQINTSNPGNYSVVGQATAYSYTFYSGSADQHAGIETSLNLSLLGPNVVIYSVEWMPGCGNDLVVSNLPPDQGQTITPEPASLLIWAGALSLVVGGRLRSRRKTGC